MTPCGKKSLKGGGIGSKVSAFSQKFNGYSTQTCKSKNILFMPSLVVMGYGLSSLKIVGSLSSEVPSFWEVVPCGFPPQGCWVFLFKKTLFRAVSEAYWVLHGVCISLLHPIPWRLSPAPENEKQMAENHIIINLKHPLNPPRTPAVVTSPGGTRQKLRDRIPSD